MVSNYLSSIILLLAFSVAFLVVARHLKIPFIIGYILVGSLVGPYALGSHIATESTWNHLAEFGVVFLMFSIGLEFSITRLKEMRRPIFILGTAQLLVFIALTVALNAVLDNRIATDWRSAVILGAAFAISSTAIVSKILKERQEINSPYGNKIMAVLIFQDIAVLPLLVFVSVAQAPVSDISYALLLALGKLCLVALVLFVFGKKIIELWMTMIAKNQSQELFTLNLLMITLGAAWLSHFLGLSMALGAFMVGILISETRFNLKVEEEIKPFRDVLLGLFFISIGMSVKWPIVLNHILWVLLGLVILTLLKFFLIFLIVYLSDKKKDSSSALRCSFSLAQTGEFSFVLIYAYDGQLFPAQWGDVILAAMVLSMALTPFLVNGSAALTARLSKEAWAQQSIEFTKLAAKAMRLHDHVIIIGYGACGRSIAEQLKANQVSYHVIEKNISIVNALPSDTFTLGDGFMAAILKVAGINRASAVVVAIGAEEESLKILAAIQQINPHIPIAARADNTDTIEVLERAGAHKVISDSCASSDAFVNYLNLLKNS